MLSKFCDKKCGLIIVKLKGFNLLGKKLTKEVINEITLKWPTFEKLQQKNKKELNMLPIGIELGWLTP